MEQSVLLEKQNRLVQVPVQPRVSTAQWESTNQHKVMTSVMFAREIHFKIKLELPFVFSVHQGQRQHQELIRVHRVAVVAAVAAPQTLLMLVVSQVVAVDL